jgi:peptidoglycan hydrolase-like protein with peptidoglycan-binding domain
MILKNGSKGEEVKALQAKLGLVADGNFGPGTEKAIKEWQTKNGLTADGIIGPASLEKLGLTSVNQRGCCYS